MIARVELGLGKVFKEYCFTSSSSVRILRRSQYAILILEEFQLRALTMPPTSS